jgi:predicted metal-binding protein
MMRSCDLWRISQPVKLVVAVTVAFLMTGCGAMMRSVTTGLSRDLTQAILDNNDLETVATGGPAYLLMIDGLLVSDPDSASLLMAAANLYSQYASTFVTDPERAKNLSQKALTYAQRALCLQKKGACGLQSIGFQAFSAVIDHMDKKEVPALYTLGAAWTTWIQCRKEDWDAIAELPRARAIMERVVALQEGYEDGGAHMYLGVFATLVPPAAGGKPEVGRAHFQRALELSGGKNLMIYVLYAKYYARVVFDRALHDRLLTEALARDPEVPGYVLMNTAAQKEARALLDSADDYF